MLSEDGKIVFDTRIQGMPRKPEEEQFALEVRYYHTSLVLETKLIACHIG